MSTNYIDQITDTAGTTHDITESDSTRIFRATCSTAAATAAKVATLDTSNRNFTLAAGVRVAVTFTYGNSATTPTLRVDGASTGTAKTIATATGAAARTTGNGTTYNTWGPYETIIFTYDGTYWVKSASGLSSYTGYANVSLNGSSNKSPSFYAPTSVGTSGQILYSSGSGAPVWGTAPGSNVDTFLAIYNVTPWADILAAYNAGDYVICKFEYPNISGLYCCAQLVAMTSTSATFMLYVPPTGISIGVYDDDTWDINVTSYENTDEKLALSEVITGNYYYPIVGIGTSTNSRQYDTTGFKYKGITGTTNAVGSAILELGNSTTSGTAGNKQAQLIMYGTNTKKATITLATPSADIVLALPTSGGTLALTSQIPTIDDIYPVGSVYVSSTNTNPSSNFGGTWELVDKEFKHQFITSGVVTKSPTNVTSIDNQVFELEGHHIWTRVWITNKVVLNDDAKSLFTIDVDKIGINSSYSDFIYGWTDQGNGIVLASLPNSESGSDITVESRDVVTRGTATTYIAASSTIYFSFEIHTGTSGMLDSFCDKFYWKRTA